MSIIYSEPYGKDTSADISTINTITRSHFTYNIGKFCHHSEYPAWYYTYSLLWIMLELLSRESLIEESISFLSVLFLHAQ